ncbi:GNAT family N-acetyltransferase [Clostridium sp. D2Q-11]|uniref:GNAT family N-acetyltransferase n=1 Tax=Anaeromonas frigoriresistens TaxID=2683708 RepID=A0A942UX63_9FIRM|nr:GNAT family protein [Anaeromonas frigoriresistens]MBS4538444.1 GNAT family N-acetyltransferase [Anaeromonas frigoriresistens]
MFFETDRVRLRKMRENDIEVYNKWSNDEKVISNTYPNLDIHSLEDTEDFYNKIKNTNNSKTYIIEEKIKKTPLGITSLTNIDFFNRNAEFIIDIGEKNYWGKGYATEVVTVMLDYTFKELNLHRIYLKVFSFNKRAIRLYEKFGFKHEGKMREALYREGKWHNIIIMGLLQSNYLK